MTKDSIIALFARFLKWPPVTEDEAEQFAKDFIDCGVMRKAADYDEINGNYSYELTREGEEIIELMEKECPEFHEYLIKLEIEGDQAA